MSTVTMSGVNMYDIVYDVPTNPDTVNVLYGLSVLLKYDCKTYFDSDWFYPCFQLYAKVAPEDLTTKELENMTTFHWQHGVDDYGDNYWQYDFSKRHRDN